MKTKFSIDLQRTSGFSDSIVTMIARHNEGVTPVPLTIEILMGFIQAKMCEFPSYKDTTILHHDSNNLEILEGGKTTIVITTSVVVEDESSALVTEILKKSSLNDDDESVLLNWLIKNQSSHTVENSRISMLIFELFPTIWKDYKDYQNKLNTIQP